MNQVELPCITITAEGFTFESDTYGWDGDDFVALDKATNKMHRFTRADYIDSNLGRLGKPLDTVLMELYPWKEREDEHRTSYTNLDSDKG